MKGVKKILYQIASILALVLWFSHAIDAQISPQIAKGDAYFNNQEYTDAIDLYLLAYQMDESIEVSRKLAETYHRIGQNQACEKWLENTINFSNRTPEDILKYAEILKVLKKYPEAIQNYKLYLEYRPDDSRALEHTRNEQYYQDLWGDSLKYRMHILGVNGDMEAFGVVPYGGNKYLFSASQVNNDYCIKKDKKKDLYLDIYQCELDSNEQFINTQRFDKPLNTRYHDGPVYYDMNSKTIYVTRNNMDGDRPITNKKGEVILKIYTYKNVDGEWQDEAELPLNSEEYSTGHPCLSADGKTLYFSSNIPGGYGKADLYKSKWEDDHWGQPINLGPNVNTEGDEMFPYVSKEGIIYFASNGHAGLGGLDNFMCEPWGDEWSVAYNLGSPINTNFDDFSLLFVPGQEIGFFTSNRGGKGFGDIYFFKQVDIFEQQLVGRVLAEDKTYSLQGKKIRVTNLHTDQSEIIAIDSSGYFHYTVYLEDQVEFSMLDTTLFLGEPFVGYNSPSKFRDPSIDLGTFIIPRKTDIEEKQATEVPYQMAVVDEVLTDLGENMENITSDNMVIIEDYLLVLDNNITDEMRDEFNELQEKAEYLKSLIQETEYVYHDETEMMVLREEIRELNIDNIYFAFDSYAITAEASKTLDQIIKYMIQNPDWKIEIDTHTDSRGSNKYNKYLSEQRANSVRRYLKYNGIPNERILLRWHGENELVTKEITELDYQLNRRAEFRYLINSNRTKEQRTGYIAGKH